MTIADDIRTVDGFLHHLHNMSPRLFVAAVAGLTDADRRKLSKPVQEHAKQLRKEERDATTLTGVSPAELMRRIQGRHSRRNIELAAAHLGLLAVAPKSANIVPLPSGRSPADVWTATEPTEYESAAISILLDRRPDWAQEWLERQLQPGDFGIPLTWDSVTRLIDGELCVAPDTREFAVLAQSVILRADLSQRPELVEYIWPQFRHSTGFLVCDGKLRR